MTAELDAARSQQPAESHLKKEIQQLEKTVQEQGQELSRLRGLSLQETGGRFPSVTVDDFDASKPNAVCEEGPSEETEVRSGKGG